MQEHFITIDGALLTLWAAITWNLATWWFGIPSSSSHTLIGSFAGAAITNALYMGSTALSAVNMSYILTILAYIVLAPLMGLILGYLVTILILYICRNSRPANAERWFKRLQLVSSAALSYAHGGNDAQKVMGIIYVAVLTAHVVKADAHCRIGSHSLLLSCATGTMSGGWRIVKTMGSRITKITPLEGVAAESAGALTLFFTQYFGIPVSTTHTITGSIIGVGLTKRLSAVRWGSPSTHHLGMDHHHPRIGSSCRVVFALLRLVLH